MNILVDGQTLESPEINRGIGIYFKNVLNNMVKRSFSNVWYISVSDENALRFLDPWVSERIVPIVDPAFSPSADYSKAHAYTDGLMKAIEEYHIDTYWNPNPFMVNVLFPLQWLGCNMFITVHDIIPAVMPVKEWSSSVKKEYFRRLEILKDWENLALICVSNASKNDIHKFCGDSLKAFVTLEAADSKKFYTERLSTGVPKEPTIVFTGGFDYRKNMEGALESYAKAYNSVPESHPLKSSVFYFICQAPNEKKESFYAKAKELGVREHIVLTGYISDDDMKALYGKCDLFFFPSLYEGFGLPILEAMLGGAYILSADNSSLPEVCGDHAIFCDAKNINDMADKLVLALEASLNETVDEKRERQKYALSYSWEKTAEQTLQIFSDGLIPSENGDIIKRKIAIITPWPEQKTGIANYVYKLLPYLSEYFYVDIFVDNTVEDSANFVDNPYGECFFIDELDKYYKNYDELIFEMGNSAEYHSGVYEAMLKYKGIAEIHDFILHPFFYHAFFLKKKGSMYRDALKRAYGQDGLIHYQKVKDKICCPDNEKFPMCESVTALGKATIFHNHWSKKQLPETDNIYVIPHPCFDKHQIDGNKSELKNKLEKMIGGKAPNQIIIGCFGYVNENKRPQQAVQAVKTLIHCGYDVKLVFWGNSNIQGFEDNVKNVLNDRGFVSGYLSRESYVCALELTDIVLNLRYPSMGEASGTLCEAYKYGKAVIVSDVNQYKEYPDEVCWKVPVGRGEQECLTSMLEYLIDHEAVRKALGENARDYAEEILSVEKIAKQYWQVISEIMQKEKSNG